MVRAKRHHLVPAFYLTYFADPRGRVIVRSKVTGADRAPEKVTNVALEASFYDVREQQPDRIEQQVLGGEIEARAKLALDAVLERDAMPQRTDREAIARFMAVQLVRGRPFREYIDEVAHAFARVPGTPSPGSTVTAEEFAVVDRRAAQAVLQEALTVDYKVRAMLEHAETVVPHLLARSWVLLRGRDFITGDLPFIPSSFTLPIGFGLGVAVADFLFMPISPARVLFLARPGDLPETVMDVPEVAQLDLRRAVWGAADRETYRNPATPHP